MSVQLKDIDKGWAKTVRAMRNDSSHVAVGVHGAPASAPHKGGAASVVDIATVHEFGNEKRKIPQRSFIRSTVDAERDAIARLMHREAADILTGKQTMPGALNRSGLMISGFVKKRIAAGIKPDLKEATIRRKGSSKPLIDSGQLRNAVTHEVRRG